MLDFYSDEYCTQKATNTILVFSIHICLAASLSVWGKEGPRVGWGAVVVICYYNQQHHLNSTTDTLLVRRNNHA